MRKDKIISFLLVIMILITNVLVFADESDPEYKRGFDIGLKDGKSDGRPVGIADKQNGTNTRDEVKDRNIADYIRDNFGKDRLHFNGYRDGYTKGFEESYNQGYQGSGIGPGGEEGLTIYGPEQFGEIMGRIDGYIAYKSGRDNDWERYIPSRRDLVSMYELDKETREYEDGFIEFFEKAYEESFNAAFQVAKLGEKNYSYEQGLIDGDEYAQSIASLNARKDYFLGRSNDYRREMPSDSEIIKMFNLNNESREYRDAFLAGFEYGASSSGGFSDGGYMLYYNDAYREANKEAIETPDQDGEEGGIEIGSMKGEYAAIIDITLKKSNSWERHKTDAKLVKDEFGLGFQSDNYADAFVAGYWSEFMKSYNETYKRLQQDKNKIKTHTEIVGVDGAGGTGISGNNKSSTEGFDTGGIDLSGFLSFFGDDSSNTEGTGVTQGVQIPGDDKFFVSIDPGTYFNDVVVTIDSIPKSFVDPNSQRHTQASEIYGLKILNTVGSYEKDKSIVVGFKSYGNNEKYGIYKYHYNKWIYIPSKQEGDYIVAEINTRNIDEDGNIYAVRVDNQLPIFHEIRGHWGKNEINTYVKREVIYGYPDITFRPDREITRGEFLSMLSRLYDWYPPYDSTNVFMYKDFSDFGYAEKAISYATYHRIVGGYPDGTFRPDNNISYKEVEIIMNRVLGIDNFKWNNYAERLIYQKGYRSASKDSLNNNITRAEFTFLLHQLNEWQY